MQSYFIRQHCFHSFCVGVVHWRYFKLLCEIIKCCVSGFLGSLSEFSMVVRVEVVLFLNYWLFDFSFKEIIRVDDIVVIRRFIHSVLNPSWFRRLFVARLLLSTISQVLQHCSLEFRIIVHSTCTSLLVSHCLFWFNQTSRARDLYFDWLIFL